MSSQPRQSRIRVQKSNAESLQILLLPSGPDRAVEIIAVLWTLCFVFFTSGVAWTIWKGTDNKVGIAAFVLVPHGLVAWGLIYTAIRRRYLKSVIAVNRAQFLMETRLGKQSSTIRLPLDQSARALLGDQTPNPGLVIQGQQGKRPVSTSLEESDQRRLVAILNRFFDAELSPEESWSNETGNCALCGMPIPGSPAQTAEGVSIAWACAACVQQSQHSRHGLWEPLTAWQVTELTPEITVHADDNDQLDFSYLMLPAGKSRSVLSVMFPAAMVILVGILWSQQSDAHLGPVRIYGTLLLCWIAFSFVLLMTARIRVRLTRDNLEMIWGRGPFRFRRRRKIAEVTDCRMVQGMLVRSTTPSGPQKVSILHACGIIVGNQTSPLVTVHGQQFSQQVVRLIRTFFADRLQRPFPEPVPYQKEADVQSWSDNLHPR